MQFRVDPGDWQRVVPPIPALNPEIWTVRVDPVVFTWIDFIHPDPEERDFLDFIPISFDPTGATEICKSIEPGFSPARLIPVGLSEFISPAIPSTFDPGYYQPLCQPTVEPGIIYPELGLAFDPQNWRLNVKRESDEDLFLFPRSLFFVDVDLQPSPSFSTTCDRIYLEFMVQIDSDCKISELVIELNGRIVKTESYSATPLSIAKNMVLGVKVVFQALLL